MVGIYMIRHEKSGKFYIGASKDIEQRFYFHKLRMKRENRFDCDWIPDDKCIDNYDFVILEQCSVNDLREREDYYIKTADPTLIVNTKSGLEQKSHRSYNHIVGKHWYNNGKESRTFYENEVPEGWVRGRITGISGLLNGRRDSLKKGTDSYKKFISNSKPRCEYIDTSDLDIKILSNNEFIPLKGVLKNNKKASLPLCQVTYMYRNGNKRAVTVTIDHPLRTNNGRKSAEILDINDRLIDSRTGEEYQVLDVKLISSKSETYDVETDNDMFDLSGIVSHNCRTRVMGNVYDPTRETTFGRGNLSFTSINLPRIAIEVTRKYSYPQNIKEFFKVLYDRMNLVFTQLDDRFEVQAKRKVKNYPFLMGQGVWIDSDNLNYEDEVREVLKHGTLTVGFIGLAETLKMLTGYHHGESSVSQKLGLEIVKFMRNMCDERSQEKKMNYSLIATPAEGLSGRFTKIDQKKYGIISGVTDREYYTNSFHVPVYYNIDAFTKIDIEAPYHELTNGGHISYIEMDGDPTKNVEAFETIIRYMHDKGIGYGSINHAVDRCDVCGYTGIIDDKCPRCGNDGKTPIPLEKLEKLQKNYPDIKIPKCSCGE